MPESKRNQTEAGGHQSDDLFALVRQQSEVIQELRSKLSTQISNEIANSTNQPKAHQALQALVGDVPIPIHGCPISPVQALKLVHLIREESYDLIIEFGSGASTLLILRVFELAIHNPDNYTTSLPHLLSFEHSDLLYRSTADLVSKCGNRNQLDLLLTPLSPWSDSTGDYNYYSCTQAIADALKSLNSDCLKSGLHRRLKLLVLINGPSGSTGRWARYPAVPEVLNASSSMDVAIDFFLDDMHSDDGRDVLLTWEDILKSFNLEYQRDDYDPDNGSLLLRIQGAGYFYYALMP